MFQRFKKYRPINEYLDEWIVTQGQNDGKPMLVRLKISLKDAIGHPDYKYQVGVAVPLISPTTDGLVKDNEAEVLTKIEDSLCDTLVNCVLSAVITTNGMREFVFYAPEWKPEELDAQVKAVEAKQKTHQLQFMMQQDPGWSTFKALLA